jgi:hypothetical protein
MMPCPNTVAEREHNLSARDAPPISEEMVRWEIYDKAEEEKTWDRFAFIFEASDEEQRKLFDLMQSVYAHDSPLILIQLHNAIGQQMDRMKDAYYRPQVTK